MEFSAEELQAFAEPDWTWLDVFNAATVPYRGIRSAVHASRLLPGELADCTNGRAGLDEALSARLGISSPVADATGLPSSCVFKGASEPFFYDGKWRNLQAVLDPADSRVHVYARAYSESTGWDASWAKLTASSGIWGDTRLSSPTTGFVKFLWAVPPPDVFNSTPDPPVCIISDGAATRVCEADAALPAALATANQIGNPAGDHGVVAELRWGNVKNSAATADAAAGAFATVQVTGAPLTQTWQWVTGNAAAIAGAPTTAKAINFDSDVITFGSYTSATVFGQSRQIVLIAHATDNQFWKTTSFAFNYAIGAGGFNYETVSVSPRVFPSGTANYEIVVYDLQDYLPLDAGTLTAKGIRFTATAQMPPGCTVTVYGFAFSGIANVPGGTRYGVCRRNSVSRIDSAGIVCRDSGFGSLKPESRQGLSPLLDETTDPAFNARPCPDVYNKAYVPAAFIMPLDSRIGYDYTVYSTNPTATDLETNGADRLCVYRQEPTDRDFYLCSVNTVASYSGGWTLANAGSYGSNFSVTDSVKSHKRNFRDILPKSTNEPPPARITWMDQGNDRAYVAEDNVSSRSANLLASDQGHPLRFNRLGDLDDPDNPDPRIGFVLTATGERGMFVKAVSEAGAFSGQARVLFGTTESVYSVERAPGSQAALYQLVKQSYFGCSSGHSVCEVEDTIGWMDKNREWRVLGSPRSFSRSTVQDHFDGINGTYLTIASAVAHKGRVRLAIAPTSGGYTSNALVMVYNVHAGYWESRDTLPLNKEPQQWIRWRASGQDLLYYYDATGKIREYEKSGQYTDDGTAIDLYAESQEYVNEFWMPIAARHMGVVCLDVASGTMTTTRTFASPAQAITGTITLDASTAYAWAQDAPTTPSSVESPGGEGVAVRFKYLASLSAAFSVYALRAEVKGLALGGNS